MLKSGFISFGALASFNNKSAGLEYLLNFIPFDKKKDGILDVAPL